MNDIKRCRDEPLDKFDGARTGALIPLAALSPKAAGRVLGKRPGAVRTAAYRGLRKLATFLEHSGTASGDRPGTGTAGADGETATPT